MQTIKAMFQENGSKLRRYALLYGLAWLAGFAAALLTQYAGVAVGFASLRFAVANVFVAHSVCWFFLLLFNKIPPAMLLFGEGILLLGVVNRGKMTYLVEPVTADDFTSVIEALDVARLYVGMPLLVLLFLFLAFCAAGVAALKVCGRARLFGRRGRAVGVLWAAACCLLSWNVTSCCESGPPGGSPRENAREYGYFLSFLASFQKPEALPPEGYSEQFFIDLKKALPQEKGNAAVQPHILLILLESAVDPYEIAGGTAFAVDPIPNLRSLREQGYIRNMVSSEKGGKTANVEYEALTGLSMAYLPENSTPYKDGHIAPGFPSLPLQLQKQGYATAALHLNRGAFWAREKVYRNMGIQQFLSLDKIDKGRYDIAMTGTWARDDSMYQIIVDQFEQAEGPLFLFALTVENHGPYLADKYPPEELAFHAERGGEYMEELTVFAQGLHATDALVGRLMEYFKASGEPAAIVFFGDHTPALPRSVSIGLDHMTTPCGFWSNYGLEPPKQRYFSASGLPAILLDWVGLEKGAWFGALAELQKDLPVNARGWRIDGDGNELRTVSPRMERAYRDLAVFNYGALFGERYARAYLWDG